MQKILDTAELGVLYMLEGKFSRAVSYYMSPTNSQSNELAHQLRLTSALAANQANAEASKRLRQVDEEALNPSELAVYKTAHAFLQYNINEHNLGIKNLKSAIAADSSFTPAVNALGRHYLIIEEDLEKAREMFQKVLDKYPSAIGPMLDIITIDLKQSNTKSAWEKAQALFISHPTDPKAILALISMAIGRLRWFVAILAIILSLLTFIAYIGPFIVGIWILISISAAYLLRRTTGPISLYPASILFVLIPMYLIRAILIGQIIP